MINIPNSDSRTAVHVAAQKRSAQVVKFLLNPEYNYDKSLKDGSGKNLLHFVCITGTDESKETCEIVTTVVRYFSPSHLNEADKIKRTALHWMAVLRLPKIAQILVSDDKTNVLLKDKYDKTPLHYACENGRFLLGSACVEVLIGRKMETPMSQINYLFRNRDKKDQTSFRYACLNCPPSTLKKYLTIVPHSQYLTEEHMGLLYKECPQALTPLMDNSITDDRRSFEEDFLIDYGSITGYTDHVKGVLPQAETTYLKEALKWDYETKRQILLHPLVELFILKKWRKLRYIITFWVTIQLIWLGAYTTLVLNFFTGPEPKPPCVTSGVMLIYVVFSMINEFFECWTWEMVYFLSMTNIAQLARNIFALLSIYPVLTGSKEPETWQKYVAAAGSLLSYILIMGDIGKLYDELGFVIESLRQVWIKIGKALIFCSPLLIGFTIAFVVIFDDNESVNSYFPIGPIVKVLVMMTGELEYKDTFIGDDGNCTCIRGDQNGTFIGDEDKKLLLSPIAEVRLLFFLIFLISVPVAFFNLLTAFGLDKVMLDLQRSAKAFSGQEARDISHTVLELRGQAKVVRLTKQLEHIHLIESILLTLSSLMCGLFSYDRVMSCLRKFSVTRNYATTRIDPSRPLYTNQEEKFRKKMNYRDDGECWSWRNCFSCWESELDEDVVEKIYAIASKPTSQEQCSCTCNSKHEIPL